jgi:hypothetical protein
MNLLMRIFGQEKSPIVETSVTEVPEDDGWIEFSKEKPSHEVVIAACDTYDCGWVMDTVWWYEDKQCWMTTGVESQEAHLPYTHWRKLPPEPKR